MEQERTVKKGNTQAFADYEYPTLMRLLSVSVSKHLLDEHFTLIWANDFYYDLIGYSKEEYEAEFHNRPDLYYANHKDEWNQLGATVMNALKNHESGYRLITTMPRKNGEHVWVQICNSFVDEYIDGYQVSYTLMTNVDDFVRMQKEQSITYNNLPGFVAKYLIEDDGLSLLEANDRFHACFDEDGKSPMHGLSNLYKDKNADSFQKVLPLMKQGKPVHFTITAKDKDGAEVWLQVNADCIDWQNDKPIYLVIYIDITEITEQRKLQYELEKRSEMLHDALKAAEQANTSKSDFLSRMSHDIRTPMNAIVGMTSIAAMHIDDKDRVLDCLKKITLSTKLLTGLINEVLDMSRIESGKICLNEEEFTLGELLQNIAIIIQPSVEKKHHTFDIHAYELTHEEVIGDSQHIQQVFLNVLSNAVKYTNDFGTILFEIKEKTSNIEGYGCYEFIIEDNGYGMEPEFIEKVFEPFERSQNPVIRAIQGTGLGMAISRNIVQMMNGDIVVESHLGKGSKFTITLHLKIQKVSKNTFTKTTDFHVLVVDDDMIACETTCARLQELGFQGDYAISGKAAIKKVEDMKQSGKNYFIIIIDVKMPDMDGIETTRIIRTIVGPDIPIILISAYDYLDIESRALEAGVNGFVAKPMLKTNLSYAIKKYAWKEDDQESVYKIKPKPCRIYENVRVLLVEDNELNSEIAVEILSQAGLIVETASNGQEAITKFSASSNSYYSLIFMDLQMPVMDGLEATYHIRHLDKADAKTIPIIAMTANAFAEDIAAGKEAGMNAHIAKPLDINLLYNTLDEFIK